MDVKKRGEYCLFIAFSTFGRLIQIIDFGYSICYNKAMDNTAIKTLETLRELCGDEGYKIIDAEDILSRLDMDADSLFETIDALDTEQLVAVKYSDKTEYCLSITKTGILKAEEARGRRQEKARESERIERLRREQAERERMQQLEAESKNKKGAKAYRKKEREPAKDERESVAVQDVTFDAVRAESDVVSELGEVLPNEPMHARQATLVLREVILNRETMRAIARVAFFSGLIGAAIGSLIISLIFVFL